MTYSGIVKSTAEGRPITGVKVTALDDSGNTVRVTTTDETGAWNIAPAVGIAAFVFEQTGFVAKRVPALNLPSCVRLLEEGIVGYQNKLWFHPGDRPQVFVHSVGPYRARLVRQGIRKELVLDLGSQQAHHREAPNAAWVADGLRWTPSWDYVLPATLQSGLYSLALQTPGHTFAVPFVVATPAEERGRGASIVVLANTPTWQAYNFYGGRSKYHSWEEHYTPPNRFTPSWRYHLKQRCKDIIPVQLRHWLRRRAAPPPPPWQTKPLSIHRPFPFSGLDMDQPETPFTNHLAGGEWRLLAWLEREGIAYDFIAAEELHADPDLLSRYRAVILNTHAEYVSKEMYAGLRDFHEQQRGWLLNLSGNSLYCEVELTDNAIRVVGGLFMDTCTDESQLLGVRFTRNDIGTCAPFRVLQPKHWAFAGVDLSANGCFGKRSLNQDTPITTEQMDPSRPGESIGLAGHGASGWETDKRSDTAPRDITTIAKGMNRFGGADMVIREPAQTRGGMFSASSITFAGSLLIDPVASQLVKNVVERAVQEARAVKPSTGNGTSRKRVA
jgi:hypothetical protein